MLLVVTQYLGDVDVLAPLLVVNPPSHSAHIQRAVEIAGGKNWLRIVPFHLNEIVLLCNTEFMLLETQVVWTQTSRQSFAVCVDRTTCQNSARMQMGQQI